MSELTNTVKIEIGIDEEGTMYFTGGWAFDEDYPEENMLFLQDVLAGVYAILSTQSENVVAAGQIMQSAPGFEGFGETGEEPEIEIVFEPDEELVKKMKANNQEGTLNVIKFDPKKHRKH